MLGPHIILTEDDWLAIEMRVLTSELDRRRYYQARKMCCVNPHPRAAEPPVEDVRLRYWYLMGLEEGRKERV